MNNKILFLDLDGALLCDDRTVSEKNREAIRRMLAKGHYVALATGRSVESGRAIARNLGVTVPGCYMIAFNGAVLYDCAADRTLLQRSIPIDVVHELFERAKRAGIYAHTYNKSDILSTGHTRELDYYLKKAPMTYKLASNIMDILEEEPHKVMLIAVDRTERLIRFQQRNQAWERGRCVSVFASQSFLEYSPLGTSKGSGVMELTRILNMPADCTIAVGDERNDISMLQASYIGVAVKNAVPELKAVADYVTERDNNHDAVAEIIEKFIL